MEAVCAERDSGSDHWPEGALEGITVKTQSEMKE